MELIPDPIYSAYALYTKNYNTTECSSAGLPGQGTDSFTVGREVFKTILCHPFRYVTTLIQIGYEPLPPFGGSKPGVYMYYPNKLAYLGYIYHTNGFFGLYRGLTAHVAYRTTRYMVCNSILNKFFFRYSTCAPDSEDEEQTLFVYRCTQTMWEVLSVSTGILASHPFYVIMVRRMGSVVGGETDYDGIFSVLSVYQTSGILGYFKGLTHRLIAGAVSVIVPAIFLYSVTKLAKVAFGFDRRWITDRVGIFIGRLIADPIAHNCKVVSSTMTVNNSGLAIGTVPYAPVFKSDFECFGYLAYANQLDRGYVWRNRPNIGPPMLHSAPKSKPIPIPTEAEKAKLN